MLIRLKSRIEWMVKLNHLCEITNSSIWRDPEIMGPTAHAREATIKSSDAIFSNFFFFRKRLR